MFQTPIVFIIFNRPETTARVFSEIAKVKPAKLFVIADGPRSQSELSKCIATRAIIDSINWECELITDYSDINLGCGRRVSSGLNNAFQHYDEAIILEDDCLPHASFFPYCAELLERYRYDERVMLIGGNNFQEGGQRGGGSYYFSRYFHIWGWASWKRAWRHYDYYNTKWPQKKGGGVLKNIFNDVDAIRYWSNVIDKSYRSEIDTWDYQMTASFWMNDGLAITPQNNLVSNIGFGPDATHTIDKSSPVSELPTSEITFPLTHPDRVEPHNIADQYTFRNVFMTENHRVSKIPGLVDLLITKRQKILASLREIFG